MAALNAGAIIDEREDPQRMLFEQLAHYQDYNNKYGGGSGLLPVVVFIMSVMRRLPAKAHTSVREEIAIVNTRNE